MSVQPKIARRGVPDGMSSRASGPFVPKPVATSVVADQPEPPLPRRYHVREVWDACMHGAGAALKALALYAATLGLGWLAFMGLYYYLVSQRLDAGIGVLLTLDLETPLTATDAAVRDVIMRRAAPPPVQLDLLFRAFAGVVSVIYWIVVLARPGRQSRAQKHA